MSHIHTISLPFMFILILFTSMFVGLGGTWLVRRNGWMIDPEDNGTAEFAHSFVGVLYAVALGLMVVGVQSSYTEVEMVVMKEASLAGDLYKDSEGLSGQGGTDIQNLIQNYVDAVISEWSKIQEQMPEDAAEKKDVTRQVKQSSSIIDELLQHIVIYKPVSECGFVIYAEVLDGVNDLLDQRRERLHLGTDGVGIVTWSVVILGALVTIGMAWFYNTKSARAHYGLVTGMLLMFSLMIFLILAMDYPLLGRLSVGKEPFDNVRSEIIAWKIDMESKRVETKEKN